MSWPLVFRFRHVQIEQLQRDVRLGLPPLVIAARNGPAIHPNTVIAAKALGRLISHRAWPFEAYVEDPEIEKKIVRRTRLDPSWVTLQDIRAEGAEFVATGPRPQLLLRLERALPLAAIELVFVVDQQTARLPFVVIHWDHAGDGDPEFPSWGQSTSSAVGLARQSDVKAWIYDVVDSVRLDMNLVWTRFEIRNVTLLELSPDWLEGASADPDPALPTAE